MKVVIYCRYSCELQNPKSCADQERDVRAGLARLGIDTAEAEVICDAAESDTSTDRIGFDEICRRIQNNEPILLAVDDQSRFTRLGNTLALITDLVYAGGRFISVCEQIDTAVVGWKLKVRVMELHHGTCSDEIGDCVRRGQRERVLVGKSAGDSRFGFESFPIDRKSIDDRIVSGHFSHVPTTGQFTTKSLTKKRIAFLCLLVVSYGYIGLFGSPRSTVLAHWLLHLLFAICLPIAAAVAVLLGNAEAGVGSYTRFSSSNQDERTIVDQQRDCRGRAARDGLAIAAQLEFSDEAVSGAKHSRAGFDRMLEAARAGQIKTLYVANLSRLARDLLVTLQVLRELVFAYKVRVISLDESIDTDVTENWELLAAIFGAQNEQFLKTLAKNVFRGLVEGVQKRWRGALVAAV